MHEVKNFKRKRANRSSYVVNPDGNCTPSDSDTDDEEPDHFNQRKIVRRRQSSDNNVNRVEIELNDGGDGNDVEDGDESSNHSDATESTESQWSQGNSQLLYAALEKLQELESELAALDEAEYDSGHHDDDDVDDGDDIDEGNDSDFDGNGQRQRHQQQQQQQQQHHDHHNEILDGEAEALGFAFCVKETFEYLAAQGVTSDNPIISSLRERFLGQCNHVQFQ